MSTARDPVDVRSEGVELIQLHPFRSMEEPPSVAERMRAATDEALEEIIRERVEEVMAGILRHAKSGLAHYVWPQSRFTAKAKCDSVADRLDALGFICKVRAGAGHTRWWRETPAEAEAWEVMIEW